METRNAPFFNKEDRISKLPEALIHHILSFLDMKYAVQTCCLSKKWRYIWTSLHTLNFDSNIFFGFERVEMLQMVRFIDFVDRVLILRDISDIQRFHLVWHHASCDAINSRLNTWILAALGRNVQELSIDMNVDTIFRVPLPHCLFNCKSLMKLKLVMGGVTSIIIPPKSMVLPRLKCLWLGSLSLINQNLPGNLLSICPVLESLILTDSELPTDNNDNFNIYSLKLKHFEINNCGQDGSPNYNMAKIIKVYAPNLRSFICKDYMTQDYSLENLSSLVSADIKMIIEEKDVDEDPERYSELSAKEKEVYAKRMMKFLRALHNVKELRLSPGFLEVLSGSPDLLESQPPQFSNLQCLKLEMWLTRGCLRAIAYLLKISPNIESLFLTSTKSNLADVGDDWEAGLLLPCMLHHLKFVEIRGVEGCVNELKFLEFLLKNAMVLEEVVLFNRKSNSPDRVRQMKKFSKKLRTFPRSSSGVIILFF